MLNPNIKPVEPPKPRARHQAKRSLTELASPARLSLQHLRPRPSHGAHDDRGLLDVDAPLQTRHSLTLLRPDGTAVMMSAQDGRQSGPLAPRKEDDGEAETRGGKEAKARLEQQRASVRADSLKQSLADLNAFSTETSKQLDGTYLAALEKMGTLQDTVASIKDLAESLGSLCDSFDDESRALEHDTVKQLEALGRFDEQEAKITRLQGRVHEGRAKIQALTGRVDVVRERIEGWERADKAWQEKTRKRLKIIWSVTSILLIALAIGVRYTGTTLDDGHRNASSAGIGTRHWFNNSNRSLPLTAGGAGKTARARSWETPPHDDERLRVFDEL